ncbi:MAG: polyhydroxyalkanoate synthesis repressor PhaR [Variovorax sp.]
MTSASKQAPANSETATLVVPRTIKKYPNRRLYDTQASTYITLTEIRELVLKGTPFAVRDAKNDQDLTRSVLLQIVLEEEAAGAPLFSEQVLANIIRFYGQALQGHMGAYLERSIQAMTEMQTQLAERVQGVTPDLWSNFMATQSPMIDGAMANYFEQSSRAFAQMQEQMQERLKQSAEQMHKAFGLER